jgi:2-phospho-L-lactate guanylyltransferase
MRIIVPVKSFDMAKRRLASVLSEAERRELARIMLIDLLGMLVQVANASGVLVISREPAAEALAAAHGAEFIPEEGQGLCAAVMQGAQYVAARGEPSMLMIPSDVPLASAAEIDRLILSHPAAPAVSIVSDLEGVGTNAIACSPPDFMPFLFGARSYAAHCQQAEARGARVNTLRLSGLSLDVDTPEDLRRLLTYETETETLAFLCDHAVAPRLVPRHSVQRVNATH